jgi:RNA polymerase sigma factor (sigma-70 family)
METPISLLERLRRGADPADWRRLDKLYRPLIRRWVLRDPALREDADDFVQDVMSVLVRKLSGFHRLRLGSFRCWVRLITHNEVRAYRCKNRHAPRGVGGSPLENPLAQLADPNSELSRLWDQEHDRHVIRRLLELLETDSHFDAVTLQAFRMVVFDEVKPAAAAAALGMTVNSVLLAKSRILKRLRQECEGLLD